MKKARQVKVKDNNAHQEVIQHDEKEFLRLNKYISRSGFCSRREADRYIKDGSVIVDGEVATMGCKLSQDQTVSVNGHNISSTLQFIYLMLHKPIGIECTTDISKDDNIVSYIEHSQRIFPIGRLDKDSSGLILLSNDGDVVNKILRSTYGHEKEYVVTVDKRITQAFLDMLRTGVTIYNPVANVYQTTQPCIVYQKTPNTFHIILSEGLNRQIRRMCVAHGYHVKALKRIRIMNLTLDGLHPGDWRYLTNEEIRSLNEQLTHKR